MLTSIFFYIKVKIIWRNDFGHSCNIKIQRGASKVNIKVKHKKLIKTTFILVTSQLSKGIIFQEAKNKWGKYLLLLHIPMFSPMG